MAKKNKPAECKIAHGSKVMRLQLGCRELGRELSEGEMSNMRAQAHVCLYVRAGARNIRGNVKSRPCPRESLDLKVH